MVQNKGLILAAIPDGFVEVGKHLTIESREFDLDQEPPPGGVTVKVHYVSFDPYQRGRMRDASIKSYIPAFELGKPITNTGIVSVIKSNNPKLKAGDVVIARQTWTEEYSVFDQQTADACQLLDNPYHLDVKEFLGALGLGGLTAYSSFYAIGAAKKGETILVSSASGAVGQIVGQIAKHEGLTVIGSVGDDEKLAFITEQLGFDSGFNYKKESPDSALSRLAPNGIDIYYENVGGKLLEAAIDHMNDYGRIIASGMISQYNNGSAAPAYGVKNLYLIVSKRIHMQGFIVSDAHMGPKYAAEHQRNLQKWISEGTFKTKNSVTYGIDHAGEGLVGLFQGKHFGKAVLEVSALEGSK